MRWAMASTLVVGTVLAAAGLFMDWITLDGHRYWDWVRPLAGFVAFWVWVPLAVVTLFLTGIMVAAARHDHIPRGMSLAAVICSIVGGVAAAIAAASGRASAVRVGAELTWAPWLLVVGFAMAAAASVVLWRTAVAAARRSEDELARANRELARRDGSLPAAPEHDSVPRL